MLAEIPCGVRIDDGGRGSTNFGPVYSFSLFSSPLSLIALNLEGVIARLGLGGRISLARPLTIDPGYIR